MTKENSANWKKLVPVMLCFFSMGFVDLVGSASNFVKENLNLTAAETGFIPSLVFFWFFLFSVPTSLLMNRIGRRNTVLLSLGITLVSLIIPIFTETYVSMLLAFSLLGIGNAVLQTSLNPLVSCLISPSRLASTLTFGQFVKALASLLAPYLMSWGAVMAMPEFGLGWRVVFPVFGVVCVLCILLLSGTTIEHEEKDKAAGILECLKLIGIPFIALSFVGIMCHVGIDVGTNTFAPQIMQDRLGMSVEDSVLGTQIYFYFRTAGCLLGTLILARMSAKGFFMFSVLCMLAGMAGLIWADSLTAIICSIALIGFGNSNIFSVVFSQAISRYPDEQNEISGLMIMGLIGGTVFPLCMGFAQDAVGIAGAVVVMIVGVAYLAAYSLGIKKIS